MHEAPRLSCHARRSCEVFERLVTEEQALD